MIEIYYDFPSFSQQNYILFVNVFVKTIKCRYPRFSSLDLDKVENGLIKAAL